MSIRIALDAGHGNNTPGKRAPDDSMREFHFNGVVANYVAELLRDYEGVATQFVHDPTGARDVPLGERTRKANNWGADVYVSIHANAFRGVWHTGGGIETYVYTTNPKTARALAEKVQAELIKATGLRNRGVKTANFQVLRETKMPAILVECGFMDNRTELALLKSDSYRRKCAQAIVDGLANQYGLKKKVAPKPAPTSAPKINDKPSDWAVEAWEIAKKHGITDGSNPQGIPTREQVVTMIVRALNLKYVK